MTRPGCRAIGYRRATLPWFRSRHLRPPHRHCATMPCGVFRQVNRRFRGSMKIKTANGGRHALAEDRLGVFAVLFFTMSAVAPLTVCAGVFPTTYAVTGMTSIPAAMIVVAVVLAVFSVGYV